MRVGKKTKNKARVFRGKTKQHVGRVTRNNRLKREGKADEVIGNLKNAGERALAAFRR